MEVIGVTWMYSRVQTGSREGKVSCVQLQLRQSYDAQPLRWLPPIFGQEQVLRGRKRGAERAVRAHGAEAEDDPHPATLPIVLM